MAEQFAQVNCLQLSNIDVKLDRRYFQSPVSKIEKVMTCQNKRATRAIGCSGLHYTTQPGVCLVLLGRSFRRMITFYHL